MNTPDTSTQNTPSHAVLQESNTNSAELLSDIISESHLTMATLRFRPNLVVSGAPAFEEDQWQVLELDRVSPCTLPTPSIRSQQDNKQDLQATSLPRLAMNHRVLKVFGPCVRCAMVNVNPYTGNTKCPLFATLAKHRKIQGKIQFGVLLAVTDSDSTRQTDTSSPTGNSRVGTDWDLIRIGSVLAIN